MSENTENENYPSKPEDMDSKEHAVDGLLREKSWNEQGAGEQLIQNIMHKIGQQTSKVIESEIYLFGHRHFFKIAASIFIAIFLSVSVHSTWIQTRTATAAEISVFGQNELTPGAKAIYRIQVENGHTHQPIPNAELKMGLKSKKGTWIPLSTGKTNEHGLAIAEALIPEQLDEGQYTLEVMTDSTEGKTEVSKPVQLVHAYRTMISTDKPMYQPGQTIHIRTLSLATSDLIPSQDREVTLEIEDPKTNLVFRKKMRTSKFGLASTDFQLADQVNTGAYTIRSTIGDRTVTREVNVENYKLPKYKIILSTDRSYYQPGQTASITLRAIYTFGKPVSNAEVNLEAQSFIDGYQTFATLSGKTAEDGSLTFQLPLDRTFTGNGLRRGDASLRLLATVKDSAGHELKNSLTVSVTQNPIRVEIYPESGELVQNVPNIIYIITAYPDGTPAITDLKIGASQTTTKTSDLGIAKVILTPDNSALKLSINAQDQQGQSTNFTKELEVGERSDTFLVRTDKVLYRDGETLQGQILTPASNSRVFLDIVKDQRTLEMQTVEIKAGKGLFSIDIGPDMFGTLELHAYRLETNGEFIRDTKVVQVVRNQELSVTATLDRESYLPAEKALIKFAVTQKDGSPTTAALSVSAVDEAVFALSQMRPGLEELYFLIQEEILQPRYQLNVRPPVEMNDLIQSPTPNAPLEEATVVLFSAAHANDVPVQSSGESFEQRNERFNEERQTNERQMWTNLMLTPLVFYILSFIPFFVIFFKRLQDRTQLDSKYVEEFKRRANYTLVTWNVSTFCPILFIFIFSFAIPLNFFIFYLSVIIGFILILHSCRSWGGSIATEQILGFRKFISFIPYSYLLAFISSQGIVYAAIVHDTNMRDDFVLLLIIFIFFSLIFNSIFLVIIQDTYLHKIKFLRLLGITAAQTLFKTIIPCIIIGSVMIGSLEHAAHKVSFSESDPFMQMITTEFTEMEDSLGLDLASYSGSSEEPRIRKHFPETLLWHPELITDENGLAQLEIPLADSITTWRVSTSAVSSLGELGSTSTGLQVFQDFFVDIDFPKNLTQNDEVEVPIALYNYLNEPQKIELSIETHEGLELLGSTIIETELKANQITSLPIKIRAIQPGLHQMTVKAKGSQLSDAIQRKVRILPDGKAITQIINEKLGTSAQQKVIFPEQALDGASDLYLKIYPGKFSQVLEGMENIFRMPYGCFEQTSSTTYPNILVLDYLRSNKKANPELEMKALNFINLGYQRLLSYECDGGGFEWFGNNPAHNVLTAYGLMEFYDMSKVYENIDPDLIHRTQQWLLSQQKPDGSWSTARAAIISGSSKTNQDQTLRTTAYITWALAETGMKGLLLTIPLNYIKENLHLIIDPYTLALCANALSAADRHDEAMNIITQLNNIKQIEGDTVYWKANGEGITHSFGKSLDIETTALIAYAMMKSSTSVSEAHKALAWLIKMKDSNGTWYSTQATVLAMRALLMGSESNSNREPTKLEIFHNEQLVKQLDITPENSEIYHLISLRDQLNSNENEIRITANHESNLAYQLVQTLYVPWKNNVQNIETPKPLSISVDYDHTQIQVNEELSSKVRVTYHRKGVARMTLIDLGIPPGFDVITSDFDDLRVSGLIERYEITGRQIIVYLNTLESEKPLEFNYRLKAKYPLRAKTPASKVYQYYEPEISAESEPQLLTVE